VKTTINQPEKSLIYGKCIAGSQTISLNSRLRVVNSASLCGWQWRFNAMVIGADGVPPCIQGADAASTPQRSQICLYTFEMQMLLT
jgi:hypothetical protein